MGSEALGSLGSLAAGSLAAPILGSLGLGSLLGGPGSGAGSATDSLTGLLPTDLLGGLS
ncbi:MULTISPECIES: hypothetical protein [Dietzia]|uniref:Uncharacterized protein n=1 Tax=Dietzia cinnamea TaxID=321318 RepID=A0A4R3ZPY5_9ACTN|nr:MULTISPECIES: hypothetical protein [Dietzia]EFV92741.1 hypothetical protein ES5_04363 [Dietzia cinnamea P4]MCT1640523.1 hypothetical protein [Dietzia cinnamea]TCW19377.1 hypothetical protein EDD19_1403 [Dietzia cinnamea]